MTEYNQFTAWLGQGKASNYNANEFHAAHWSSASDATKEVCLICFDLMCSENVPYFRIQSCGHCVCIDCWTAYVESVASSERSATIACPAHQCTSSIGLLDMLHILYHRDSSLPRSTAASLFSKLASNEFGNCLTQGQCGRYCPTPDCGRLLMPSSSTCNAVSEGNILLCTCGQSVCAACPGVCDSHPGIQCTDCAVLRENIDSGRVDAEFFSNQYLMNHSRHCPRCSSAIERDGGCNHIMCSQCRFYFCWQCGGPWYECLAFPCKIPVTFGTKNHMLTRMRLVQWHTRY